MSDHLLDTCVLIDYLRDREAAAHLVRRLAARPSISVVTIAELFAGIRNDRERDRIEALPTLLKVRDVDIEIAGWPAATVSNIDAATASACRTP